VSAQLAEPGGSRPVDSTLAAATAAPGEVLFQCLAWVARHHGDERSVAAWQHGVAAEPSQRTPEAIVRAAQHAGHVATIVQRPLGDLSDAVLPAIVLLHEGLACVLMAREPDGRLSVAMPESPEALLPLTLTADELSQRATGYCVLFKPRPRHDERAGAHLRPPEGHWFWSALWCWRGHYANVVLAAVMINVLTLAGTFFTMNVYDRVVPTHAYPTLWTLAIGTTLAMVFEFASRQLRSHLVDDAGKKIDLVLGSRLFQQAMGVRMERRAASSGSFAYRLREFESVREFTTSATVSALTDLPFGLLFLAVIVSIGGPLAWVLAVAIPLVLLVGLIIQWPLARHMSENLREGALKHGLLVETLEGIETLKSLNGQGRMQRSWDDYSAVAAQSAMKSRALSSLALNVVSLIQQLVTVVLVVWGVYLIHEGHLSQGALIGVVMLSRQAIGPMAQVVGLAVRFQQAKASMASLNTLMAEPLDHDPAQRYLSRARFDGSLRTEGLVFNYPEQKLPALEQVCIDIRAGERVAILGRIGSGKSTLMRLLSGLYQPCAGSVYADGIDLRQLDPADVHHNIGLVAQDGRLFYGSLKDNLTLGAPHVSTERILSVCRLTGLDALIARHPQGLDMMLGEGGSGLSGGQRQLVALARALIVAPPVLLMDEPTSAMDAQTESAFIAQLKQALPGKTLVVATHRLSLLELVDRVIIMEQGRVVADGPKQQLLQALTSGGVPLPGRKAGR
jgi:ATP-binding cassette subfamily C protein LapB